MTKKPSDRDKAIWNHLAESHRMFAIDDTYRRLLELYSQIDQNLTLRLARRAAAHSDPDTREAGEEFLRSMKSA